jgi:hypothetical protein
VIVAAGIRGDLLNSDVEEDLNEIFSYRWSWKYRLSV